MAQTDPNSYGYSLAPAQAGQKYDIRPDVVTSLAAEVEIAPGQPVKRGTDPEKQCVLADANGFGGVALFTHAMESPRDNSGAVYKPTMTVSVLTQGAAYVKVAADVTAGENAFVTTAAEFTNAEDTNAAAGEFLTSADTGDLAVIQV